VPVAETLAGPLLGILVDYEARLKAQPRDHETRLAMARLLFNLGDTARAVREYQPLMRVAAMRERVIADLEQAVQLRPNESRLWQALGDAYQEAGSSRRPWRPTGRPWPAWGRRRRMGPVALLARLQTYPGPTVSSMRIGILSDTHDHIENTRQALEILRREGVERLFHCGDVTSPEVVALFEGWDVLFVRGNMDRLELLEPAVVALGRQPFPGR
jgi:tetratricopeptide (TPR) repeat protein